MHCTSLSGWEWDELGIDSSGCDSTSCCSAVTVMRTGSASVDRLRNGEQPRRDGEEESVSGKDREVAS